MNRSFSLLVLLFLAACSADVGDSEFGEGEFDLEAHPTEHLSEPAVDDKEDPARPSPYPWVPRPPLMDQEPFRPAPYPWQAPPPTGSPDSPPVDSEPSSGNVDQKAPSGG